MVLLMQYGMFFPVGAQLQCVPNCLLTPIVRFVSRLFVLFKVLLNNIFYEVDARAYQNKHRQVIQCFRTETDRNRMNGKVDLYFISTESPFTTPLNHAPKLSFYQSMQPTLLRRCLFFLSKAVLTCLLQTTFLQPVSLQALSILLKDFNTKRFRLCNNQELN